MNGIVILLSLAVFSCVLSLGEALKCHQCSSYNDEACADPYAPDAEPASSFLKECPADKEYILCRKIYQNVRGDVQIIRACGVEEYKKECYKTVLEEYNTLVCQCKEDGCNPANISSVSYVALMSSVLLAILACRQ